MRVPDPVSADPPGLAEPAAFAPPAEAVLRRWRRLRAVTVGLLLVWALVAFVLPWNARRLDFNFFGWPFSFWMAAQGAILVFLALVVIYAAVAHRLDVAHGLDEHD